MTVPQSPTPPRFRLSRLQISNFKAIDDLDLELPPPLMRGDPDVLVLGSRNGVGKTSVLEACALLWFSRLDVSLLELGIRSEAFSLREQWIRSGSRELRIRGSTAYHSGDPESWFQEHKTHELAISDGGWSIEPRPVRPADRPDLLGANEHRTDEVLLRRLFGVAKEPLCWGYLMYFHSNRGVEFGVVQPGRQERVPALLGVPFSGGWFKDELLFYLMARSGLIEDEGSSAVDATGEVLGRLFREFADGEIAKLRSRSRSAYDVRVRPRRGSKSFSFDGLSSGQKEMIATLFLIWQHTRNDPALVLIDEPELHLNAEWQIKFMRLLFQLAPFNQYILATHSEHIFGSVEEDRRLLLDPHG